MVISFNDGSCIVPLVPETGGAWTVTSGDGLATHVALCAHSQVAGHGDSFPLAVTFFGWVMGLVGATPRQTQSWVAGTGSTNVISEL